MKYEFLSDSFNGRSKTGCSRPPLISFKEISEKYNIPLKRLVGIFGASKNAPKIILNNRGGTVRNSWYVKKEVEIFMKEYLASKSNSDDKL